MLLSNSDWLLAYDRFLFARVESAAKAQSFIWDITIKDGKASEIEEALRKIPKDLRSCAARAHSDRVTWQTLFPDFKSQSAAEEARMIMGMILAGFSLPEHWLLGQGGDVNRATAVAMGDPTVMRLMRLQNYMRYIIYMILKYHLDHTMMFSSTLLSDIKKPEDEIFNIVTPPIDTENVKELADTLQSITQSLSIASDYGWAEDKDLAALWCITASKLGIEMQPAEDLRSGEFQEAKKRRRRVPAIYKRDVGY